MRFLLLCFLFHCYTFSANIGIVSLPRGNTCFFLAIPYPHQLQKYLSNLGHQVEEVIYHRKRPNFAKYDILLTTIPQLIPMRLRNRTIVYIDEPPVVLPISKNYHFLSQFFRVFHWNHNIKNNPTFKKSFFGDLPPMHPEFKTFSERKLVCLINSIVKKFYRKRNQLYTERKAVAEYYLNNFPSQLSLYGGRGWSKKSFPNFLGYCPDKGKALRDHKFSYCYENWDNDYHYISEKILDCIANRCVPIYLGSSKISDYIPKEAYINARTFNSIDEIHQFISDMDEQTWLSYIKAMEAFDKSKNAKLFRAPYYIKQLDLAIKSLLTNHK